MKLVDFLNIVDEHFTLSSDCGAVYRVVPGVQQSLSLREYAEIEDSDILQEWLEKHEKFLSNDVRRVDFDKDGNITQITM